MSKLTIGQKLCKIQQEFKSKKSRFNTFGKFNFRSAEDILEGLKPLEEKYEVYFKIDEEARELADLPIIESMAYVVDAIDGSSIVSKAIVGVDLKQKGMQVPQQFGSASSYAKKYSLGNLLLIDDTQDADASNTQAKSSATQRKDKPWINKGDDALTKALAFVVDQKTYDQVRGKYSMSNEINEELLKQIK